MLDRCPECNSPVRTLIDQHTGDMILRPTKPKDFDQLLHEKMQAFANLIGVNAQLKLTEGMSPGLAMALALQETSVAFQLDRTYEQTIEGKGDPT